MTQEIKENLSIYKITILAAHDRTKNVNSSALIAPEFDWFMFLKTPVAIFLSIDIFSLATMAVSSSIVRYPSIFKSKS